MCGICGVVNFNGEAVDQGDIYKMTNKMKQRGPDDDGYYFNNDIGLGMRRLSIIDIEKGKQPISNEKGDIWVVMNGEIYNHVEIRKKLQKAGHTFKTSSDTEVIVHLYEEKGRECLNELNGMFAFALYDVNASALWIVRDRLGIKPLYYINKNNQFVFSSDLNSLKEVINTKISVDSLINYMAHGYIPTPETIFDGIKKLKPAHWIWIQNKQITTDKYWQIDPSKSLELKPKDATEKLEELMENSLRLQMRSDVPVGILLSGGLDSSGILAFAAKNTNSQINTLTINFDSKNGHDHIFANKVSDYYNTNHFNMKLNSENLINGLMDLITNIDEPIADSAIVPTYLLSRMAQENGIKVLLTGAGGDEIFGGYNRHKRPKYGSPAWVSETFPYGLRMIIGKVWGLFNHQRGIRATNNKLAIGTEIAGTNLGFYQKIFNEKSSYDKLVESLCEPFNDIGNNTINMGYSYSRMFNDLNNYLLNDILALTDKGTMAASVEGRVPLLDHKLVEFAFSLSSQVNLLNGKAKGLFKEVLKKYLPTDVINRKKEGFNAPITVWMMEKLNKDISLELNRAKDSILSEIIDIDKMQNYLNKANYRSSISETVFSLYVFSKWCRTHNYQ